ncbi:MAG: FdtA/QdtA family cupin domain-containing protein [Clostridia bacterium]|nr:FdtA/QdtA family cupin domain-containing protein [Clostridia bacterium]
MNLREKCRLFEFTERGDERGQLVVVEALKDIPFEIKRIFYIYGANEDTVRGRHANKKSDFVFINLAGSCKIRLYDGTEEYVVTLDRPNVGLYVPKLVWKDMYDFSSDAVLLTLSDEYYDPTEYIRGGE